MASVSTRRAYPFNGYPTSDGRPLAETDWHRDLMNDLIGTLKFRYARRRRVYVSGNLLLFYILGNRRRHVSPDVFVVKGVPNHNRANYLLWQERKGPNAVFELTSSSTRKEDQVDKSELYQDVLKVPEYFLFAPFDDYLGPPLQSYRLLRGKYHPILPANGRLPSKELDLFLERNGQELRLHDPVAKTWLPTQRELAEQTETAEAAREQAETARQEAEVENERLRRELDELRRRLPRNP